MLESTFSKYSLSKNSFIYGTEPHIISDAVLNIRQVFRSANLLYNEIA